MPVSANTNFYEGNVDIKSKYLATSDSQFVDLSYFSEQGLNDIGKGLWAWGGSPFYGIGFGDRTDRSSPTQIGSLTNWKLVDTAYNLEATVAVKSDGTLWTWGRNEEGQLGLSDRTHRSSPVQIGSLTNWSKACTGGRHCLAIKTDGTLWSWGYNNQGELGLGNTTNRSSPVQVGLSTDWKEIFAGDAVCYAIKNNNTLWGWGSNAFYAGISGPSSPVQVGTATWSTLSTGQNGTTLGVQTDGTLWSWGSNSVGQLGLGDTTNRNTPTQAFPGTTIKSVYTNGYSSFAVSTDGQARGWGQNSDGMLGLNSTTNTSFISNIGNLTNWKEITAVTGSGSTTVAVKTDGTLWAWGGLSNINGGAAPTRVSSPVQIGSLTGWVRVDGGASGFAVKL